MSRDFFSSHEWTDADEWHFLVVFDKEDQVQEMASKYAETLSKHDGLYPPVPGDWLHLTLLRVGPVDRYTEALMKQVVDKLRLELDEIPPPTVAIGPCWSWSGSICAHVTPEGPISEIQNCVTSATASVLGLDLRNADKFIPHVTLAYPRESDNDNAIRKDLYATWVEPVTCTIREVVVVRQRQVVPHYAWTVGARVPIGRA